MAQGDRRARPGHRCLTAGPAAGRPPDADARPTPTSRCAVMGRIVAEFLEALDLRDVTLCFNDWCGAQVMIADGLMDRVGSAGAGLLRGLRQLPAGPRRPRGLALGEAAGRDVDDAPGPPAPAACATCPSSSAR